MEFICEGVGSVLMSVGSISCVSARQQNAGSPQHVLVGNKRVSPKSLRCCVHSGMYASEAHQQLKVL